MLTSNLNAADQVPVTRKPVALVTYDEDYVYVRFDSEQYVFAERRSGIRRGGLAHVARTMQEAAEMFSASDLKRLLIDNAFQVVQ